MATQTSGHTPIPFSIARPLQNVRLLEVPDDLLEIITAQKPLRLVSEPAAEASSSFSSAREGFLHLCSEDKVWTVKQVSTSNSVYIARTGLVNHDYDEILANDEIDASNHLHSSPNTQLTAFAKPSSVLELHEVPIVNTTATASQYLIRLVPPWPASQPTNSIPIPSSSSSSAPLPCYRSIEALISDIPCPTAAIQTALSQAAVFTDSSGYLRIPTQTFLLETWRKTVETCTLLELPLTSDLARNSAFQHRLRDDLGPEALAVSLRILDPGDGVLRAWRLTGVDETGHELNAKANAEMQKQHEERTVVSWLAVLVIRAHCEGLRERGAGPCLPQMARDKFMCEWQDSVPAAWIRYCDPALLQDVVDMPTGVDSGEGIVVLKDGIAGIDRTVTPTAAVRDSTTSTASTEGSKKRKWHEKFAAQRDGR